MAKTMLEHQRAAIGVVRSYGSRLSLANAAKKKDSEEAARAFLNDALLDRVAALYGVRPTLEFVQVVSQVENASAAGCAA